MRRPFLFQMQLALFPQSSSSSLAKIDAFEMKLHSKVKLFTDMVETLMAFVSLFFEYVTPGSPEWTQIQTRIAELLSVCHRTTPDYSKFSVESEMMKIAVYGDHSALSTLFFFQVSNFFGIQIDLTVTYMRLL